MTFTQALQKKKRLSQQSIFSSKLSSIQRALGQGLQAQIKNYNFKSMNWNIAVYLLANYFAVQQHTKNVVFMNCCNDSGKKTFFFGDFIYIV